MIITRRIELTFKLELDRRELGAILDGLERRLDWLVGSDTEPADGSITANMLIDMRHALADALIEAREARS